MNHFRFAVICFLYFVFHSVQIAAQSKTYRIAFGSCAHQEHPLPVFRTILKQRPDLFLFLGDNIYADTRDTSVMKMKYTQLAQNKGYQRLRKKTKLLAIWDDHDYGENDAGRHYPMKEASKKIFLDFFQEPVFSERRTRPGNYTSFYDTAHGRVIQILLLDNRTFRDGLVPFTKTTPADTAFFYQRDYLPHTSPDSTLLGKEQWAWLEKELLRPADLRIVASSTQFAAEYNGYESWSNFPHEQEKMFSLIKKTKATGLIFLSGDVHYGELSKRTVSALYPIYDLTASGLSSTWEFATPNSYRIAGPVMENHFGMVSIELFKDNLNIIFEIIDIAGTTRIRKKISLHELKF